MSRVLLLLTMVMIVAACDQRRVAPAAAVDRRSSAAQWERVCTDNTIKSFCFPSYTMVYSNANDQIRTVRISVTSNEISLSGDLYLGRRGVVQIDANDRVDMLWNYNINSARTSMTPEIHQQIMAGQTMIVRFTEWPAGLGHEIQIPLATLKSLLQVPA
jgi:invasion protein IalB